MAQLAVPSRAAAAAGEPAGHIPGRPAEPATAGPGARPYRHLTVDSRVDELLSHPACTGFAPLLLPWDDRDHDRSLTFNAVATLLPYHTAVNPAEVVGALNQAMRCQNPRRW